MLTATLLALSAALLHATWNLIIKVSRDRDAATWALWLCGGTLSLPVLLIVGLPQHGAWPFLAASATIHVGYAFSLARAYRSADFSLAYPLARGTGALLVALGGTVLLSDHLSALAWVGICIVGLSLVLLAGRGATLHSMRWAVLTGVVVSTYMLIDGAGSRHAGSGLAYGLALQVLVGVTVSISGLARRRQALMVAEFRRQPFRLVIAGACVTAAYTMVLVAYNYAPVGYVAVLRESSVLIGAVLGWLFLRERFGRHRAISAIVMLAGMSLLIAGG